MLKPLICHGTKIFLDHNTVESFFIQKSIRPPICQPKMLLGLVLCGPNIFWTQKIVTKKYF